MTLHHGENLDVLPTLAEASVDAIVTDPPYGLRFMGKAWDYDVPTVAQWAECLRVLKPGGHLLAFAGTRTQHRMAVNIEDAGFEIRDMLAWVYGSGFPKSLDVGKAIDKEDKERQPARESVGRWLRARREDKGLRQKEVAVHWPSATGGLTGCVANWELGFNCPTWEQWHRLKEILGFPDEMDAEVWRLNGRKGQPGAAWFEREVTGTQEVPHGHAFAGPVYGGDSRNITANITAPATEAAQQWDGWGTALKPALEPITLARKPLSGTVAQTVLEHGTGALNIDASRIGTEDVRHTVRGGGKNTEAWRTGKGNLVTGSASGRWPANLVHDGSDEVTALFPESEPSGIYQTSGGTPKGWSGGVWADRPNTAKGRADTGSAARFFYVPKASNGDRGEDNDHPTVKPVALMHYLLRLVTPPGGTVLDPFSGSGTTLVAGRDLGFSMIGIDREESACAITVKRLAQLVLGLG